MIAPGKHSTEHARAWRAEALGVALCTAGIVLHQWPIVAIGAALVGITSAAYSLARASPKAAMVRRPADQAPRKI